MTSSPTTNVLTASDLASMTPGTIPAGSVLPDGSTVLRSSLTAYEVTWTDRPAGPLWVPFSKVHPLVSATPLVVFA